MLKPLVLSHGWIHLLPAKRTKSGFEYSLCVGEIYPVLIRVIRKANNVFCICDQPLKREAKRKLRLAVSRMLSLDFPLEELETSCKERHRYDLLRLAKAGWGRILRSPTAWEDAVKTLCTTNASWGYTQQMCKLLCEKLGRTTQSGTMAFPLPEDIVKAGLASLKKKVRLGYRAEYLFNLAKSVSSGEYPWLMDTSNPPMEEKALKAISSWRGFGTYATSHMMMLLGFHKYLPVDREVANHLGVVVNHRRSGVTDAFEEWGNFRFTVYKLTRVLKRSNWIGD